MKTLLSDTPGASCARAPTGEASLRRRGQALLAPGLSASVTSQLSLHPSINTPPRSPAALSRNLLRTSPRHHAVLPVVPLGATAWLCRSLALPVVEVNGFEP